MEAYVNEVRKLEAHFDGLQAEHVPHAENSIADDLSKRATKKLPVEPGTFVLLLNQPSVTPSMGPSKRRKLNSGEYFVVELPAATGKEVARNNSMLEGEQQAPA
jgi:hypothetical protein